MEKNSETNTASVFLFRKLFQRSPLRQPPADMQLLAVLFLLILLVLGQDDMLLAGNLTTHFPAPVHQCFDACQPDDVQCMSDCVEIQHFSAQQVNSINSCIAETCSLRDSTPTLKSYHLCRQSCMKSVSNGNNGTFPSAVLTFARTPSSDIRTQEVNGNFHISFVPSGANNSRNPRLYRQVLGAPRSLGF
jgi:hypothetical protein